MLRARTVESTRSQHNSDICRRFAGFSGAVLAATRSPVETSAPLPGCVATAAPQPSQNLAEREISVPHSGQVVATRAVPQPAQNLAPFRFSIPHEEHRMLARSGCAARFRAER